MGCRAFSVLVIGGMILALLGCVSADPNVAVAYVEPGSSPAKVDATLRPGDRVQVTVFGEDGITGAYDVSPTGVVQLPLIGALAADGQTVRELQSTITSALRQKYLRDPKVTVAVLTVSPFYVLGEVQKPGEYPFRTGLNVWRALAIAGGQTYRASTASVFIQHAGESRTAEVDLAQDVTIRPGDLIRVPERWF
jgi:protein involved in polysaccharide export with SLBB domain